MTSVSGSGPLIYRVGSIMCYNGFKNNYELLYWNKYNNIISNVCHIEMANTFPKSALNHCTTPPPPAVTVPKKFPTFVPPNISSILSKSYLWVLVFYIPLLASIFSWAVWNCRKECMFSCTHSLIQNEWVMDDIWVCYIIIWKPWIRHSWQHWPFSLITVYLERVLKKSNSALLKRQLHFNLSPFQGVLCSHPGTLLSSHCNYYYVVVLSVLQWIEFIHRSSKYLPERKAAAVLQDALPVSWHLHCPVVCMHSHHPHQNAGCGRGLQTLHNGCIARLWESKSKSLRGHFRYDICYFHY